MSELWSKVVVWLKSRNISSHTIVVFIIGCATVYTADQQVRDFVISMFKSHPTIPADILALCGIILKYSTAHSSAGILEQANEIVTKGGTNDVKP